MKLGSSKAWAKTLGSSFAHIQHGLDKTAEWGFAKMKEAGSKPKKNDTTKNVYLRSAKNASKGTLQFLGQLGENYYKQYEKLKNKK